MEEQQPVIVELDLQKVAKESIWLTVLPLLTLFLIRFFLDGGLHLTFSFWYLLYGFIGYLVLIVVHEVFHLLGFRIFCNVPWKNMDYGVNLKMGIAYATADQLMDNKGIRKALLLPFWMTGILPAVIALYIGDGVLLTLGALLIGGAAGDFAMYKELKKFPDDAMVKDDPELPKLYIYLGE
ncbi:MULTISPECIES: DUF3267 domain-containing protein [unclassified Sporosarcina]|uniref:DUF3267 domain-containing protein n=1 Tax=unclassified Sporosarcina TaxID=2647733 RepID=UPI00203B6ED1|nr:MULTISPECIES: DUF3267 domain-containing protein [unclassified Sporosarcina]GKV67059.1 diaminopimelate epimerase [Sporosarcina sp. NCCP-2331]GLB57389.1 diaminopimelate epimerase [Sporosarcina sp. NCCP-2378]